MLIKLTYALVKTLYDSIGIQFTSGLLLNLKNRGVQKTIEGFRNFGNTPLNEVTIPARNFIKLIAQIFVAEGIILILITKSTHPLILQLPITSILLLIIYKISITAEELKEYLRKIYFIICYVTFYGIFIWVALRTSFLAASAQIGNSKVDVSPFVDQTLKEIGTLPIDWYLGGLLAFGLPAFVLILAFSIGWLISFSMRLFARLSIKKCPADPLKYITWIVAVLFFIDAIILLINSIYD
jgi:hypothetical protein